MKEVVMPSKNLADFSSLSFTLLSSNRGLITSYAFCDKKEKKKATSRFSHKFNSLGTHLHQLIISYNETYGEKVNQ